MAKKAVVKRGRKLGQKVGPYKLNLPQMSEAIKQLQKDMASVKKALGQ